MYSFFVVNKKPVIFGTQRFCALFSTSNTYDWSARVPITWGGRSGPSHLVAVVGSVAPPEKLDSRGGKRGRGFGRAWGRMDNRRLTREEGEVLSDSEAGAQASGGDPPEGGDLATLHQLLVKTLQTQEREALKQDQRWKGVQIQLNQLRDDVDADRRRQPPPPPGLQLGGLPFPTGGCSGSPSSSSSSSGSTSCGSTSGGSRSCSSSTGSHGTCTSGTSDLVQGCDPQV